MEIVLVSLAFLVAALCAATMGLAIQRGATCTVAAVDEVVGERSARRLAALLEAALWVGGGLLVARALHVLPKMPPGYAVSGWTVGGGVLLGLGAFVNRACVFGAIARFGSGEWAYLATPLGFYVGCVSVGALFAPAPARALATASPVLAGPAWLAVLFLAFVAFRIGRPIVTGVRAGRLVATLRAHAWTPHTATTVIGLTFLLMLLLVGSWAYTDVLVELARGMASSLVARGLLLLALLGGAAFGGWSAGLFGSRAVTAAQLLRCFAGGVLMGWGSLLIPGGNDGLILVGMPLLWPYAWLAFATMCVTIASALLLRRALAGRPDARRPA
jgi:toxin CptA